MAFSFGFYNSINGDREYDALQISQIFDGIIRDGIYATIGTGMVVRASTNQNQVIVGPGRGWFNHTWNYNDADLPIDAPEAELLLSRIDALVIDVNSEPTVDGRINQIKWVKGTPSSTPEKPTITHTLDHNQYPLCYITRAANESMILQTSIENTVGTSECPFVTGILETISIDNLLLQWQNEWQQFVGQYEDQVQEWTAEQEAEFEAYIAEFKTQMASFQAAAGAEFSAWFGTLQDILDENAAGHLQNEIDAITEEEFNRFYGLYTQNTTIATNGTITSTTADAIQTTVFTTDQNGNDVITTTINMNEGLYNYVKTTTISKESDGSDKIISSYVRQAK